MNRTVAAAVVLLCIGCAGARTTIHVQNASSMSVSNVRLRGRGFSASIPLVPAGEERTVTVMPKGETGVAVAFTAGDRQISLPESGYFESGGEYSVRVRINRDLSASVEATLAATALDRRRPAN